MTAVVIAHGRAVESDRPDRLFDDPWASRFVAASGWNPSAQSEITVDDDLRGPSERAWVVIRTHFLDRAVLSAVETGCNQVVALGAGLDARAFRLKWAHPVYFYEIDSAGVIDFKDAVVGDSRFGDSDCRRTAIRSDLTDDWAPLLQSTGFDPSLPTVWIIEGVLMYLTSDQCTEVMSRLSGLSAPGSHLAMTLTPAGHLAHIGAIDPSSYETGDDPLDPSAVHQMWKSDGPSDPTRWLEEFGWQVDQVCRPESLADEYGRGQQVADAGGMPMRLLAAAHR